MKNTKLIWNDEFDGKTIDLNKWSFDLGNGFWENNNWVQGWGENQLQCYTKNPENIFLENGCLKICALNKKIKDMGKTYHFTSARLKTLGLFEKLYGRFEIKARFPHGKGFWPGICLMPVENYYGTWPSSGEVIIAKVNGSNTSVVHGGIHDGGPYPIVGTNNQLFDSQEDLSKNFHVFAYEWEPSEMRWYVDGKLYKTINNWRTHRDNYPAPFNRKFYLLITFAVGGKNIGKPCVFTSWPATLEIDYVRIYDFINS